MLKPGYYVIVYVKPHLVYVGRSDRGRVEGHDVETCWPFNVPMAQVHSYKALSHEEVCAMLKDKRHATTILPKERKVRVRAHDRCLPYLYSDYAGPV